MVDGILYWLRGGNTPFTSMLLALRGTLPFNESWLLFNFGIPEIPGPGLQGPPWMFQ